MKKMILSWLFGIGIGALLTGATPSQQNLASAIPCTVYDFAGDRVPANFRAEKGKLSLSNRHYLLRQQSLRWDYLPGDRLVISTPVPYFTEKDATNWYKRPAIAAFVTWVYNEQPLPDGKLRFDFGNAKRAGADLGFDYGLNFQGWRAVQLGLGRDTEGKPAYDMNQITIAAPKTGKPGTLWFDSLIPTVLLDNRDQDPDAQQQFVNLKMGTKGHQTDSPYFADRLPVFDPRPLTAADRAGFRLLEEKLRREIGSSVRPFAELEKAYRALELKVDADGNVTGKHISFPTQTAVYQMGQRLKDYQSDIAQLRDCGVLMRQIASTYRVEKDPAKKAQLETMFVTLTRQILDQGFADHSIRGTSHHLGYASREYFASLLLMREVLEKHGLLAQAGNSAIWYNGLRLLNDRANLPEPNADIFNTLTMSSLVALALLPDTGEKAALLRSFQTYYGRNIAMSSPGDVGGFKADGCIFHHWGHYPGYGFPALSGAALAIYLLKGTPWELPTAADDNLIRVLKCAYIYTQPRPDGKRVTAMALSGRHPFGESDLKSCMQAYRYMSFDPEIAAIYRALNPKAAVDAKVKPAVAPEGHWSFNYGCFGIHRYRDKMVTLKGYSRSVWSSEIYTNDNRYGRYQSNGAIEILPQGDHLEAGWDWNRNPGTTTLHRPLDVLESPIKHTLMLCSLSRISGSSQLDKKFGAFAVELSEPSMDRFDPQFRARKSVFAFGSRLVALGSGIRAGSEYPVETTLFQLPATTGKAPIYFDSPQPITAMDVSRQAEAPVWLADAYGNAWFVFAGGPVKAERKLQTSRRNQTRAETKGEFSVAWIDHGVKPQDGGYEYLLDLAMTPEQAAAAFEKMKNPAGRPYEVLRRDDRCHAVHDKVDEVTAAVFFESAPQAELGLIAGVDQPCYVIYQSGKTLALSLNTPDLSGQRQPHGAEIDSGLHLSINAPDTAGFTRRSQTDAEKAKENEPRRVTIRLKGRWKLATEVENVTLQQQDQVTAITALFRHGIPRQLRLIQE